jgi:hypothetical protein
MVATSGIAGQAFAFLSSLGFRLTDSRVSPGNNARYDGWHRQWQRQRWLRKAIGLRLEYYEWELVVTFSHGNLKVDYLFLDRIMNNHSSGYEGTMFSPDRLPGVLPRIAADIQANYQSVLAGDAGTWSQISSVASDYRLKAQERRAEEERKTTHKHIRLKAAEAFSRKDYRTVSKLLQPIADVLSDIERKKLEYAKKHGENRDR